MSFHFETPRLIVKPHTPANAATIQRWENDRELVYLNDDDSDAFEPLSSEDARFFAEEISRVSPRADVLHFAIQRKTDDALIGFGTVFSANHHHKRCKIGVTIGEEAEWGKGYAREALVPVIDYVFGPLGLNRIMAEIYCFNTRSIRLFESLGFQHEGTLRQSVWKRGQPIDDCLYALLKEDWTSRK